MSDQTEKEKHRSVIEAMLRARGLRMSRVNPTEELLLPPSGRRKDLHAYTDLLNHYAARLLLREAIKSKTVEKWVLGRRSVERFCEPEVVDSFLNRFVSLGVLELTEEGHPVPVKTVRSFGPTYEWYTSTVLASEFRCPSVWGVAFEDHGTGGDHDVIASLSGRMLYVEVKTSPPGRIEAPEIRGFARRLVDIAPDLAIFNNDTHLRMKDKIVPLMETAFETVRGKGGERVHFKRLEREIFHLDGAVYIINSKPDLRRNLETVLRHHHRCASGVLDAIP